MKRITLGILAHVDAGKTTLSEAMLYHAGVSRKIGRVDKRTSILDNHEIERERGITIFSSLCPFDFEGTSFTLVDTPGHIDFFAEAERVMAVLDYAVLVISATDGATAHTVNLYNMLKSRNIPTFVFVNKLDLYHGRRVDLVDSLRRTLTPGLCDFNLATEDSERFIEECAGGDEGLMQEYFSGNELTDDMLAAAIRRGKITPAVFGSALRDEGVSYLLSLLDRFTMPRSYSKTLFGAKVFKITTAPDGTRLSFMKIMGGRLSTKDTLTICTGQTEETERVEQIRLYTNEKFKILREAEAGMIVAIPGLSKTRAGIGIGTAKTELFTVPSALDYKMIFEQGTDIYRAYLTLLPLASEEPSLGLRYDPDSKEIRVKLMGLIQTEVLSKIIRDRFSLNVKFGEAKIHYLETISEPVFGSGHFEPLMHYAEVRLRLAPLPPASGLVFASELPTDILKLNWQRLIISHLEERAHPGPLTGAPITDMKITLVGGRAHPKHTEGGDFREATFRALHCGLRRADAILLEPTFNFEITLPRSVLSRLLYDIDRMSGECTDQIFTEESVTVRGRAPVFGMRSYAEELRAFTAGAGKISLTPGEYIPCHNQNEIVAESGYDPDNDKRAKASSVFCKGGAGYLVPWDEVEEKMHTESPEKKLCRDNNSTNLITESMPGKAHVRKSYADAVAEDKELMRIFEATYGKIQKRTAPQKREITAKKEAPKHRHPPVRGEDYLIIDGYNLIFSDPTLHALADAELAHARDTLVRMMCNYRGYRKCRIIIVFDAYRRGGERSEIEEMEDVTVIYTKERETADSYIERATYKINPPDSVRVVSSDYNEQLIVLGNGGIRVPCREFLEEIALVTKEINDVINS